jgi:HEAT repeat protein
MGIKSNKVLLELKNNDNYATIRDVASRELAKIGYSNEMENFYNALLSTDEELRNEAAESLKRICPSDAGKIIEAIKKEKSIRVKMLLLDSLSCASLNKKDYDEILKYTSDENNTIRYKAISVLLNSSDEIVISKIKKLYTDTPDIIIKLMIAEKLLKEKKLEPKDIDADYFNSVDNSDVKKKFIAVAGYIPDKSKPYIMKYINYNDPYVQIDAAIKIIEMEREK